MACMPHLPCCCRPRDPVFAGRRTKNHRDQQKGSGGRASSMKIAAISINRKLLEGTWSQYRTIVKRGFHFVPYLRRWYPVSFPAILPRENEEGNQVGTRVDQEAEPLLFLSAYLW
jgi:hypothetical protein